jgi:hypothetical protein
MDSGAGSAASPTWRPTFGHPGYTGALSTTADRKGVPLRVATVCSSKEGWQVTWEFHPSCARITVLGAPARYWLLYEGTPGELGDEDLCGRSDGRVAGCAHVWQEDIVNSSGVATDMEGSISPTARCNVRSCCCTTTRSPITIVAWMA